jgi:hypothetical protein
MKPRAEVFFRGQVRQVALGDRDDCLTLLQDPFQLGFRRDLRNLLLSARDTALIVLGDAEHDRDQGYGAARGKSAVSCVASADSSVNGIMEL